mmetsp:Transcript_12754/g.16634  ORF Transcript_12754/g.16634 Transcript_12754/m.16634 type:complete len:475 (+) Transcript_12754:284-1708(+)
MNSFQWKFSLIVVLYMKFVVFLSAATVVSSVIWEQVEKLVPLDGESFDSFGRAVKGIAESSFLVSSYRHRIGQTSPGIVYHFSKNSSDANAWSLVSNFSSENASDEGFFGSSISALSPELVVVGATGVNDVGAAFVFSLTSDDIWSQQAKLQPTDADDEDVFGWDSAGLDGSSVLVSAYRDDHTAENAGSAYIFTSSGEVDVWTQSAKLTASDANYQDYFAHSVTGLGPNTVLIGAHSNGPGVVYVFTSDEGMWGESSSFSASDGSEQDQFGYKIVGLRATQALVGAPEYDAEDFDGLQRGGMAYIFSQSSQSGLWEQTAKLTPSDASSFAMFGVDVEALSSHLALVGAYRDEEDTGAVYVFTRFPQGLWGQEAKLTASDGARGDFFGFAIGRVSAMTVVIGAYGYEEQLGCAYVFTSTRFVQDAIEETEAEPDQQHLEEHISAGISIRNGPYQNSYFINLIAIVCLILTQLRS